MNTKKYIEATLIDLLKKKTIDKVKVSEIIREVETCKGTFYKYYRDKYELLVSCFNSYFYNEIVVESFCWDEFMYKCLEKFETQPTVVFNAFNSNDVNSVRFYHESLVSKYLENNLSSRESPDVCKISHFTIKMCAINFTEIMLNWLSGKMEASKNELIAYMRAAMPQSIFSNVHATV